MCLGNSVFEKMGSLLFPLQLGYGTRLGAEGAVHVVRAYLTQLHPGNVMLKLDFKNAFNSIRRDFNLKEVLVKVPKVYPHTTPLTDSHPSCFLQQHHLIC